MSYQNTESYLEYKNLRNNLKTDLLSFIEKEFESYVLDYEQNEFTLKKIKLLNETLSNLDNWMKSSIPEKYKKIVNNLKNNLFYYREQSLDYNIIPIIDKSIYITGYFQSFKYFENNFIKIYNFLNITNKKTDLIKNINIDFKNTISLHFRFGDYKKYPDIYPLLDYNYYLRGINYIFNK